jgi:CheY-like chemotaxis protein
MAIASALLVSDDVGTIEEFKNPLRQLSISSDVCRDGPAAINVLERRKFDAVIVDFQLGQESATVLDALRLSGSNRTTVTLGINGGEAASNAASRKKVGLSPKDLFRRCQFFISLSPLGTSELRDWLAGKLEKTLPDFVARKFQN